VNFSSAHPNTCYPVRQNFPDDCSGSSNPSKFRFCGSGPFRVFCEVLLDLKFEVNGMNLIKMKESKGNFRFDLVE